MSHDTYTCAKSPPDDRALNDALRDALNLARDCSDPAHRETAGEIAALLQRLLGVLS